MHRRASCRRARRANARATSRLPTPCGPWKRYACAGPSSSAASSRRFASCCSGNVDGHRTAARRAGRHAAALRPRRSPCTDADMPATPAVQTRRAATPSSGDVSLRRGETATADELAVAGVDAADEVGVLALDPVGPARRAARAPTSGSTQQHERQVGREPAGRGDVQLAHRLDARARARRPGRRATSRRSGRRRPTRRARAPAGSRARRARRARPRTAPPRPRRVISGPSRSSSRIRSPSGVPPGSRTATTSWPCARRPLREQRRLRRLAGAVDALERHEHAGGLRYGRMRAVVTGGAGFIGSNLVDRLVERGDEVVVVDDLSIGQAREPEPGATFVERDIRDGLDLGEADVVFHLAAQADVQTSVERPDHDAAVNVVGTVQVLEAARRGGRAGRLLVDRRRDLRRVRRARGRGLPAPAALAVRDREALRRAVPRRLEPHPRRGPRRAAVRERLRAAAGVEPRGRRRRDLPRADGARADDDTIFGDGGQTRDFVFVGDVVDALLAAVGHDGGVFNVGTRPRDERARPAPRVRRGRGQRGRAAASTRRASATCAARCSTSRAPSASSAGAPRRRSTTGCARRGSGSPRSAKDSAAGRRKTPGVDVPAASPQELIRPWRTATLVASIVAAIELVLLLGAGDAAAREAALARGAEPRDEPRRRVEADEAGGEEARARAARGRTGSAPVPKLTRAQTSVIVLNGNGRQRRRRRRARRGCTRSATRSPAPGTRAGRTTRRPS